MPRTIAIRRNGVDNDLVVDVENHMTTSPLKTPSHDRLYNCIEFLELNIPLAEPAWDATGEPAVFEDPADPFTFRPACIREDVDGATGWADEMDTVPL